MTETNRLSKKLMNVIMFSITLLLLTYTTIRACVLSITWDEAESYIEFARNGKVILTEYDFMSANNHILNTLFMILFTKAFGLSEFAMRIPSLVAHFLFLYYSYKLLRNLGNNWLVVAMFVVVNGNPYMLDFFSLARGYGLSLGFMMTSVYYFYLFHLDAKKSKYATITILTAGLAVLANFVLLNYCVVVFGLIVLLNFYCAVKSIGPASVKLKEILRKTWLPAILMLLLLWFVIPITIELKKEGALFFGGEQGFWKDTVNTIVDRSFYELGYNYWFQRLTKVFIVLVLLSSGIFAVFRHYKKSLTANQLFLTSLLLLIGLCSLSTIVQRHVLGTPYLIERTALFLMVLFNLILAFSISEFVKLKKRVIWLGYTSGGLALTHFLLAFNFSYVLEWKQNADSKEMISDLEKIKEIPKEKETVSVGITLMFETAINFYREKNNLTWLNTARRHGTLYMQHDYFFLEQRYLHKFNMDSIEIIKSYPLTGNILAKPKYSPKEIKVVLKKEVNFEDEDWGSYEARDTIEYVPGFEYVLNDSLDSYKNGVITFSAEVKAPDLARNNLAILISFETNKREVYSWQKAYVKDFITNEEDWFRTSFTSFVPMNAKRGDVLKAYIWNPEKQNLYIQKQELKVLQYIY